MILDAGTISTAAIPNTIRTGGAVDAALDQADSREMPKR
jgi:hypothetical protein